MKRLLTILLAVLLLAGCTKKPEPTEPTADTTSMEEGADYRYEENSAAQQQTGGAVRTYLLEQDTYFGLRGMGSHLLVMGQKGLTVLTGEWGEVTAALTTEDIRPDSIMDTAATGLAYYLPNSRLVMVLNPQLQSVTRQELPKEIVGSPYMSLARNEVYYSTGHELRAMNISTGISRLLRQQSAATQTLHGIYFDGEALLCRFTDEKGGETLEFISSQTGQTLGKGEGVLKLQTYQQQYAATWQDGVVQQTVFGSRGGAAQCVLAPQPSAQQGGGRAALPAMNGMIDYLQTDNGLELSFYDLNTGKRTAQTVLSGVQSPAAFYCDGVRVWMLATDTAKVCQVLYCWDITKSAIEDAALYTGPLYTAENPDSQGLAQCQKLANAYQSQFGVKVLFWQDAVKQTGGHAVVPEHNPQIITSMMERIQPVLALFPGNFLLKTVEAGWIKIAIVQSIDRDADWVQFWEEGDCWILIAAKADAVDSFIQGLAYGIDSHVLGNSRDFDTWNQLNPEGFAYSYSDKADENSAYLVGANRAFADAVSMTYPHEDRCRVFYHAMLADNATMFQSPIMQAKLLRLCTGIREAYNLEKKTEVYTWEQYLQTPIAYVPAS